MNDLKKLQEEYYGFVKNTSPALQNIINGKQVLKVEKMFLEEFKPKKILDIGCGNGERIFPYYETKKYDFLGIEIEENLIKNSKYSHKIIKGDITDKNFSIPPFEYDLIVLWGVIMAAITQEKRDNLWLNISNLMKKMSQPFLAFTTRTDFKWFKDDSKGQISTISFGPPQYFPSEKELFEIFNKHQMKLLKTYSDSGITLYFLTLI